MPPPVVFFSHCFVSCLSACSASYSAFLPLLIVCISLCSFSAPFFSLCLCMTFLLFSYSSGLCYLISFLVHFMLTTLILYASCFPLPSPPPPPPSPLCFISTSFPRSSSWSSTSSLLSSVFSSSAYHSPSCTFLIPFFFRLLFPPIPYLILSLFSSFFSSTKPLLLSCDFPFCISLFSTSLSLYCLFFLCLSVSLFIPVYAPLLSFHLCISLLSPPFPYTVLLPALSVSVYLSVYFSFSLSVSLYHCLSVSSSMSVSPSLFLCDSLSLSYCSSVSSFLPSPSLYSSSSLNHIFFFPFRSLFLTVLVPSNPLISIGSQ